MTQLIGKSKITVGFNDLAPIQRTGSVNVLSSSVLSCLMEQAACKALEQDNIPFMNGKTSIGYKINISHKRPSALGACVNAVARVVKVKEDEVDFEIEAFDETGLIGTANHIRKLVNIKDFEKNSSLKLNNEETGIKAK